MSGVSIHLRVCALAAVGLAGITTRRRAGFVFGPEPVELTPEDFGHDAAAAIRVVAICEDPQLRVELVDGETSRAITPEDVAELVAFIEAEAEAEALKVNAGNPPTDDAAAALMNAAPGESQPAGEVEASPAVDAKPAGKAKSPKA